MMRRAAYHRPAVGEHRIHRMPAQLTSFVGRERDLEELSEALSRHRLVTITGTAGAGKTRLALEIARLVSDRYPDGVHLVELAPVVHSDLVDRAVADSLSVHEAPQEQLVETLGRHLGERCMLVVLDNCEHVLDACATLLGELLAACPSIGVLATSRQQLGVYGEAVWPLAPLPVPALQATLGTARQSESVQLFVDRARLVRPGYRVSADAAEVVAKICRSLDG